MIWQRIALVLLSLHRKIISEDGSSAMLRKFSHPVAMTDQLQTLAPGLSETNVDSAEIGSCISMVSFFDEKDIKGIEKVGFLQKG